ncbi:MAG: hypothetical protein ACRD07_23770, partial [Acidimicrobiales bacterium]
VDLDGIQLPAGARASAEESVGAAAAVADSVPGGAQVVAEASSAFTDAFTLANSVALGIALATAAAVLAVSRRGGGETVEDEVIEDYDLELVPALAGEVRD